MPSSSSDRRAWISSSFAADAFISSPIPPTSAITADVSSPFAFIAPICFDSVLRRAWSSSVRVWIARRSASSAENAATSRV